MKLLIRSGVLRCGHDGVVANVAAQSWVTVARTPVLIRNDPEGRSISMCPNVGINIKPCTSTLVVHTGYSTFIRIDGSPVCLDTVVGYTDGTPPGAVQYTVRSPGQQLVEATA